MQAGCDRTDSDRGFGIAVAIAIAIAISFSRASSLSVCLAEHDGDARHSVQDDLVGDVDSRQAQWSNR